MLTPVPAGTTGVCEHGRVDQQGGHRQPEESEAEQEAREEAAERTREIHLTMDLCLRIGEMLLSSGAGAADVTATMRSVADHLGLRRPRST